MGNEQQAEIATMRLAQSPVVQRSDDGLAGPGGGDDKVPMPSQKLTLGVELLQHFSLVGLGLHFQAGQGDDDPVIWSLAGAISRASRSFSPSLSG